MTQTPDVPALIARLRHTARSAAFHEDHSDAERFRLAADLLEQQAQRLAAVEAERHRLTNERDYLAEALRERDRTTERLRAERDAQVREAFMAGHLAAQDQTDRYGETHETPEEAFATYLATRTPKGPT